MHHWFKSYSNFPERVNFFPLWLTNYIQEKANSVTGSRGHLVMQWDTVSVTTLTKGQLEFLFECLNIGLNQENVQRKVFFLLRMTSGLTTRRLYASGSSKYLQQKPKLLWHKMQKMPVLCSPHPRVRYIRKHICKADTLCTVILYGSTVVTASLEGTFSLHTLSVRECCNVFDVVFLLA